MDTDPELQLRQDVYAFTTLDNVAIARKGRVVRLPRADIWETLTEALTRGTSTRRVEEIFDDSGLSAETRRAFFSSLNAIGALQSPPRASSLHGDVLDKHVRTLRYFGSYETQDADRLTYLERLGSSRVVLLGLGGAGSWIAYLLLLSGIGHVSAYDGDTLQASNLNRTALVSPSDLGRTKAAALQEKLSSIFPEANIRLHREMLSSADRIAEVADGHDLIIGAADMPHKEIRLWVAEASLRTGTPSIQVGGGRIGPLFLPGKSSCAGCLQEHLRRNSARNIPDIDRDRFALVPTSAIATQPSVDAAFLVHEAVSYLAGYRPAATVDHFLQKGRNLIDGALIKLPPQQDCPVSCGGGFRSAKGGEPDAGAGDHR